MTTIERLRELLREATPGEWGTLLHDTSEAVSINCITENFGTVDIAELDWNRNRENDAALIVAAVNALPGLLRCAEILHELCVALADSAFAIDLIHDPRVVAALNSLAALDREAK